MTEQQLRLGVVLGTVLVGVALVDHLWEPPPPPRDPAERELVWSLAPEEIAGLDVRRPKAEGGEELVSLRQVEGVWRVTAPVDEPADPLAVEAFAIELAQIERGVPVSGDAAAFGLESPAASITVTTTAGRALDLQVGAKAPTGGRTYVRAPSGAVAAVWTAFDDTLRDPLETLRDQSVARYELAAAREVVLTNSGGELDLVRHGAGWWLRGYGPAADDAVLDLLSALLDLRFAQRIPVPENEALIAPKQRVRVVLNTGEVLLEFGDETPMGRVVLRRGGAAGLIAAEPLAFLEQGPGHLLRSPVIPYSNAENASLRFDGVALDGVSRGVTRQDRQWVSGALDGAPVARALAEARVAVRREPAPPPVEPSFVVRAVSPEGDELGALTVGAGDDRTRSATVVGGLEPFWLLGGDALVGAVSALPASEPPAPRAPDQSYAE